MHCTKRQICFRKSKKINWLCYIEVITMLNCWITDFYKQNIIKFIEKPYSNKFPEITSSIFTTDNYIIYEAIKLANSLGLKCV